MLAMIWCSETQTWWTSEFGGAHITWLQLHGRLMQIHTLYSAAIQHSCFHSVLMCTFGLLNRWFWTSQMQEDEAYVFVNYDSRHDGRARFTPHSTIVDPDVPKDAPVRQSVETRAFVFWDE